MGNKKSQAAFEFLMTYGWAFVVILIMIAAIAYFGVLRPQKLLPDRCNFNVAFDCIAYKITGGSSGILNLRLSNNAGKVITVTGMTLSVPGASLSCTTAPPNPSNWKTEEIKDFAWSGCNTDAVGFVVGEKGKVYVKVAYYDIKSGSTYAQIAEGEIFSTVS